MQTQLADFIRDTPAGREADSILRSCVHCGFCTATCPTYQLLGDELDGPRGRIYLIKETLEGAPVTRKTQQHLDRCLTCRACETTCPSGVDYHRLLDIGRAEVGKRVARPLRERLLRALLMQVLPRRNLFGALLAVGRRLRPLLPTALAAKMPPLPSDRRPPPAPRHGRRMLLPAGCVQPGLAPGIDAAAARVLDAVGISLVAAPRAGCCGALRFHLDAQAAAKAEMRRNIDAWWPLLGGGAAEALVTTASGCGVHLKAYGELLAQDADYADRAEGVAARTRDIAEVLLAEERPLRERLAATYRPRGRVAFHAPCTLQHGQRVRGAVEGLLTAAGYELAPVADAHLCCGSAGTYSILQPDLAMQLRDDKLAALNTEGVAQIATANIGCLSHLQSGTPLPVRHWIELIDAALAT